MAAIPVGAEFAVNTKTENAQIFPEITRLSNGGFVVAWHDGTDPNTTAPFDVRLRLFDPSGNPVTVGGDANDFIPTVGVDGSQINPSIASLGENGFVVTWFDEDTSTIYARRFNNNGTAVDAVDRVVQTLPGVIEPHALSVAGKADGSFAVVWSNDGEPDVFLQVFDPRGTGDGSFLPEPDPANINPVDPNQSRPDIASMGDNFIVTWTSGANALEDDVMGRVFAPDGSALSPTEIPIAIGSAEQDLAAVTALPNGGFVTTWYQQETDQIMVGRFNADGTPVGTPLTVNTAQTDSGPVDIAAFGNDYFVVTWTSVTLDVMAQVFVLDDTAGATPLPGQGNFLVGQVDGLQVTPTVTALDGARFAISWSDFRDPAAETDFGIRAQIFKVASDGGGNQPAAFTGDVTGGVVEAGTSTPGIPTATGTLVVTDPDGPDTLQPIVAGTRSIWGYGTVELTRDGVWTYTLDSANPTVDRLAAGETLTDRFVALAADGTQQVVTITITGADDGRTIMGTPEPDTLVGTSDDDVIRGLAGRDTLTGGAGDDSIDGGRGLDTAVFSGDLAGYRLTRIDERTVEIVDIDPSDGDDGTDVLSSIELLRFGGADPVTIGSLAGQPDWTLERDDVGVTAATYQLFLHGVPAAGGFDYLVMSDVNGADLNDPYYFIFNLENRYLNFASNLGTASPDGAAWFDTEYGALTYEQAVGKAFASIVTADALRAIGADPAVALDFFLDGRAFFEAVAAERVVRPGVDLAEATKIVMLGSMLYEAVKANVGSYGQAVNDFADIVYASGTHEDLGSSLFAVA